jgi:hypothetical protein
MTHFWVQNDPFLTHFWPIFEPLLSHFWAISGYPKQPEGRPNRSIPEPKLDQKWLKNGAKNGSKRGHFGPPKSAI